MNFFQFLSITVAIFLETNKLSKSTLSKVVSDLVINALSAHSKQPILLYVPKGIGLKWALEKYFSSDDFIFSVLFFLASLYRLLEDVKTDNWNKSLLIKNVFCYA